MLKIRKDQWDVLSSMMVRNFESQMSDHILNCYPEKSEKLESDGVAKLIRKGIEKSLVYNMESERDVSSMIELMVEFGEDFEMERRNLMVRKLLTDNEKSAQARMDLVYLKMKDVQRGD